MQGNSIQPPQFSSVNPISLLFAEMNYLSPLKSLKTSGKKSVSLCVVRIPWREKREQQIVTYNRDKTNLLVNMRGESITTYTTYTTGTSVYWSCAGIFLCQSINSQIWVNLTRILVIHNRGIRCITTYKEKDATLSQRTVIYNSRFTSTG